MLYIGSLEQLTAYFVKSSFEAFGPFVWYERECSGYVFSVQSIKASCQPELELSNDILIARTKKRRLTAARSTDGIPQDSPYRQSCSSTILTQLHLGPTPKHAHQQQIDLFVFQQDIYTTWDLKDPNDKKKNSENGLHTSNTTFRIPSHPLPSSPLRYRSTSE